MENTYQATAGAPATAAKAFGPYETPAIFEKKWRRKMNDHMSKCPLWERSELELHRRGMLETTQWSIHAFDLVVAFESQARTLEIPIDKDCCTEQPNPRDPASQASWMRFIVNAVVKRHGETGVRSGVPWVEASNILIDKVVMGELQGIWFTDEESFEEGFAAIEMDAKRGLSGRKRHQDAIDHYSGEVLKYASS